MSDVAVAGERSSSNGDGRARPNAGPPTRTVTRRGALPAGRAVVGGFLVAVAALGIFVAYERAAAGPTTTYVVARHDLPVGSTLTADDLTTLPMDLPEVVARNAAFTAEGPLVGATTIGPVRKGELVQAGDVVKKDGAAPGVEVSFEIDAAHALNGTLRSGETVDVLATFGAGGDTYTVNVLAGALVLDASSGRGSIASDDSLVVTLGVRTNDNALALTHAVNAGQITLVRTTGTGDGPDGRIGQTYRAPAAG